MTITELQDKWQHNAEFYKTVEVGSGVHEFVKDFFTSSDLLRLTSTPKKTGKFGTFVHDTEAGERGRPDFVIYAADDVTIPVEVKCFGRIEEGKNQLFRYQLDYNKQYGILTDGYEWRFYRANLKRSFFLPDIFKNPNNFLTYWKDYIKPENYYNEIFNPSGQMVLFEDELDLNEVEYRKLFFDDTTKLIAKFKAKMLSRENFAHLTEKAKVETAYAYLIQFILYKVLVDNGYTELNNKFNSFLEEIKLVLREKNFYYHVIRSIKEISDFISQKIYKPFSEEQSVINKQVISDLEHSYNTTIDDIAAWLDIVIFINKFKFANLKNEIFGFIYENYLKDLYQNENRGQYFTDPAVVNYMLDIVGFTVDNIRKNPDKISLIDPACGAGTFLYSAVDRIINAFDNNTETNAKIIENLVDKNIFGVDIEEFPLYLAEMSILMRLLPLIISNDYNNPIETKLKLFKTKDSISEFLDAGLSANESEPDLFSHLQKTELGYQSFMRDRTNMFELLQSLQGSKNQRLRFDYVLANPPYISYKECTIMKIPFLKLIKGKMNNVYGVNLHSIPSNIKKYAPTPNLYAFFAALGLALLKDGGKMCFIIPQTILTAEALDVLRYHLAKNTTIEQIVTFGGNLFVDRGLAQKKEIKTSSLIFVATKNMPSKNNKVQIVNYQTYIENKKLNVSDYLKSERKSSRPVLQSELLEKAVNWKFLINADDENEFCAQYIENAQDISIYYNHELSKENFNEKFYFDRGLKYPKDKITKEIANDQRADFLYIPDIQSIKTVAKTTKYGIDKSLLDLPHGSQGLEVYEKKYKIIWRYMNYDKFRFSESTIMIDYNNVLISSDCKMEMLYLLAILNSKISKKILNSYLHLAHEQDLSVGIKSIKQYIRIPKITPENQHIKAKIIELTQNLLDLETVKLDDLVDFSGLMVQKFENVQAVGTHLIVTFNGKDYKLPIKEKAEFVNKLISEKYYDNSLNFKGKNVTLQELKNLEAIDFEAQEELKTQVDDLISMLYFGDNLPETVN